MSGPFSATRTSAPAARPTQSDGTKKRPRIKICDDLPDWSVYAWSNPTRVVYGPVSSRRLGRSLGINLFPQGKVCSFRCAYCDLDVADANQQRARVVPTAQIISRLAADLSRHGTGERPEPDSITFAGNGEPTLHPGFSRIVDVTARLRDKWLPNTPLNLFTDGMHLVDADVRAVSGRFRRVFLKLDGASEEVVEKINGPGAWRGMCRALGMARQLPNVAASTVLVGGSDANTNEVRSGRFVDLVTKLQPRELFLYTLDYPSPRLSVATVDFGTLFDCAEWLTGRVTFSVIALWRLHQHRMAPIRGTHG